MSASANWRMARQQRTSDNRRFVFEGAAMFPWLWVYAPNFQFPGSGNWAQRVDTETVVGAITGGSGNASVERKALDVASYGRQLGWITEVLIGDKSSDPADQLKGEQALKELRRVHAEIEAMKDADPHALVNAASAALLKVLFASPADFQGVVADAEAAQKRLARK